MKPKPKKSAATKGKEPKAKVTQAKRGRPTAYTEAIAKEICQRLAEGETLSQICRSEHMPARPTVILWVLDDREGFSDRYARARDLLLEYWADETIDIADDGSNDWMRRESKDGNEALVFNSEHSQRSRLRVDTRKWLLSKLKPERYGDKLELGGKLTIKHEDALEQLA